MNLKQIFCKHIWKEISEEFLRGGYTTSVYIGHGAGWRYYKMNYYAISFECVKCGKTKKVEEIRYVL